MPFIKGQKGYWQEKHRSEKTKKKIGIKLSGRKLSETTRGKMSEAKKNRIPWNKGLLGYKAGKEHYNWKGGKSFEPYTMDWTETLKRAIRERDHYLCQLCSQYGNTVHHIDYDKKNCNPDNLITLCKGCNSKVNFNRKYWAEYFQK